MSSCAARLAGSIFLWIVVSGVGSTSQARAEVRAKLEGFGNNAYLWLRMKMGQREQTPVLQKINGAEWRDYELAIQVPEDAQSLSYGLVMQGSGEVAIDAVSLTVHPIP